MKLIIAGSRGITDLNVVRRAFNAVQRRCTVSEIVSGTARGADSLGEQVAEELNIPVRQFPADWKKYGRGAGHRRNAEMAAYADGLLALWDGESSGTSNMMVTMRKLGKPVFVKTLKENS